MSLLADMKTLLTGIDAVYLMEQPDTPDNCLTMFHTGGANPAHAFDAKQFEEPTFQVIIRHSVATTAIANAEAVKDALDGQTSLTINSSRYISIMQQSDVLNLGKDAKGRTELSVNFRVKVQR